MSEGLGIEAISLELRTAVLNNGTIVPITKLFTGEGFETDNPTDAVTFVCGEGTTWLVGVLKDYSPQPPN